MRKRIVIQGERGAGATAPFVLDETDYVRAQQLHFRTYYRTRAPRLALLGFAVAWAAFMWLTWEDPKPYAGFLHACMLVLFALPLANILVLGPMSGRRTYRTNSAQRQSIAYVWSDEGLSVSGAQGSWCIAWGDYRGWTEDARLFLIYQGGNTLQIIPKRVLTPDDETALRAHLAGVPHGFGGGKRLGPGKRRPVDGSRRCGVLGCRSVC